MSDHILGDFGHTIFFMKTEFELVLDASGQSLWFFKN